MNLKEPGKEVKDELPAGDVKLKNSKGSLAYWVLCTLFGTTALASGAFITNLKSQVSDLKVDLANCFKKEDDATERLIKKLEGATQKVDNVENKIDTVAAVVSDNSEKFDNTINTLKNAVK